MNQDSPLFVLRLSASLDNLKISLRLSPSLLPIGSLLLLKFQVDFYYGLFSQTESARVSYTARNSLSFIVIEKRANKLVPLSVASLSLFKSQIPWRITETGAWESRLLDGLEPYFFRLALFLLNVLLSYQSKLFVSHDGSPNIATKRKLMT